MTDKKMAEELSILDPTVVTEPIKVMMASRLDTLDGKVACILDNGKFNSDKILDLIGDEVVERYKLARVVKRRKPDSSRGAPQEMLDEIAEECDFAIVGVGD